MSQLNVNPEKVQQLIQRLDAHQKDLLNKQKSMKGYVQTQKETWNDAHYTAFVQQFEEFDKLVMNACKIAETVLLPNLKNVKNYAEQYKNMGKR